MKIVLKYIINNIKDRKMRTAVMLLSIILSTTLLFVSLSIGESYSEAQKKMSRGMAGNAELSISLKSNIQDTKNLITTDVISRFSSIRHVVGIVETGALYKKDGYYENFDMIAADLTELSKINKPRLVNGGEITNFTGNIIILPERFTSKFDIEESDPFVIWINGKEYEFVVGPIAAYDTIFLRHTRGTNALVPLETLSAILGSGDGYNRLLIEPAQGLETSDLQAELNEKLPEQYTVSRIVNETQVEASAREKSLPFFLISFFSLTMSVFIIFSSYKVITLERLPVLGTFRSIGATKRTVKNILMLESFVYGGLGSLLGILIGPTILQLLLNGISNTLSQGVDIPMIISPINIIIPCAVTIFVSVLSAILPIKRASKLPVKDIILGTVEEKTVSRRKLIMMGVVVFVLSIILPCIGQCMAEKVLFLSGGLSITGLLVATIILIPIFVSGISSILERIYGATLGNEGRLAARNMRGNKNINQNITLLFISISAIIAIATVGNFIQVYIGDVFKGAKLDGFTQAPMTHQFVKKISQLDGVDEILPVHVLNNQISLDGSKLTCVECTEDIAEYADMFAMTYENERDRKQIEEVFKDGRNILMSSDCMKRLNIKVGDTVLLSLGSKSYQYFVLGSYKIRFTNKEAIIPSYCATEDFGVHNYGIVAYTSCKPDAVMVQIRDLFGNKNHWSRTVEEFNNDALGTINAFFQPMRNLTWFILILATVGIINNLLINHIQKRRTIAMYKSIGMSDSQNIIMTIIESLSVGLIGALIAMIVSWLEIRTIFLVAGPRISIRPELKLSTFLIAGALGICITLIGSVVPIIKNKNMKLVEELKFD